jgi:2,4-dienoyl-CoA reductase-like NADH-dependent reductase (Old Yellow Enzyme family)
MIGQSDDNTEFWTEINVLDCEAYFRDWCRQIKNQVDIPVMMVGGLGTFELMEEVILNKEVDFISLSRQLIVELGIINDWKRGDRHRAKCISCNQCFESLINGETLECAQLKSKNY